MKKLIAIALLVLTSVSAYAQCCRENRCNPGIFNHLGAGIGVGTNGISLELATPITKFIQMRAGVSVMPGITFNADADFEYKLPTENTPKSGTVSLKGDLGRVQGQVIFNVYPFPQAGFFVAAGAYFGGGKLLKISGHSDELAEIAGLGGEAQAIIGDFKIPANENGDIAGGFRVKKFRPYVGIGWGKAIPGKLVNFSTELGVQFEGEPELYSLYGEIDKSLIEDDNTFKKVQDILKVYPTLTFRLNFRAF